MATTLPTAAFAVTVLLALAAAVSAERGSAGEQAEADSKEGGAVKARQLFGFGPGSLFGNGPLGGGLGSGLPFGGLNGGGSRPGFGGIPGFGDVFNNPLFNGNGNGQMNNNPTGMPGAGFGGNPFPNNPQGSGEFNGNGNGNGGAVMPRPDQMGNQFSNGRPGFGQGLNGNGGGPGFGSGEIPNGNGNQFNGGRPGFGSGEIPSGNGNQFNGGRPGFGSGQVPNGNGNQSNGGRPGFGSSQNPNGNGNQSNGGRPGFGSGQVPNGNGNQSNGGRPGFGSGEVPNGSGRPSFGNGQGTNGNQFNGRPSTGGRPARPGGVPTASPVSQLPQSPVNQRDLLINPPECGIRDEDRIIGGNLTVVMELPWMARLGYRSRRGKISYRCGGSLINHRYVLTAAHCVGDGEDPVEVKLGEHDEDSERDCSLVAGATVCAPPAVDVAIERVIRHPQYSSDTKSPNYLKNDVALLRLRSPVTFSEAIKPICLPQQGSAQVSTPSGSKAVVSGWGKDRNRGSTGTRYLMKASVPLWSVQDCARVYQSRGVQVGPTQVCAGGTRGVDSCQGDSGGPLYRAGLVREQPRAVQVGVVSFGLRDCATEGVPGVYTRVESHMPWIASNLAP